MKCRRSRGEVVEDPAGERTVGWPRLSLALGQGRATGRGSVLAEGEERILSNLRSIARMRRKLRQWKRRSSTERGSENPTEGDSMTCHALPLPDGRFSPSRASRGNGAESPRNDCRHWPWQQSVRKRDQAAEQPRSLDYPSHRIGRVLALAEAASRTTGSTASAVRKGSDESMDRHPPPKRTRRGQSARLVSPRPSRGSGLSVSTVVHWLAPVRDQELGSSTTNRVWPGSTSIQSSVCPHLTQPQSAKRSQNSRRAGRSVSRNWSRLVSCRTPHPVLPARQQDGHRGILPRLAR